MRVSEFPVHRGSYSRYRTRINLSDPAGSNQPGEVFE